MDIRKIAMFLAGKLPPYYGSSNLYAFTKALRNFAKEEFTNDEMTFIQTQAKGVDEEVYFMVLDDLWKTTPEEQIEGKKSRKDIVELLKSLGVNDEVLGIEGKEEVKTKSKTIGFITPFDGEKDDTQEFIQSILNKDYKGWDIKTASLKDDGKGGYLWDTIKDFMKKYDFYIIDFRNGNLNVAIELGYILNSGKPYTIIIKDKMPSDITGFIYVRKPDLNLTGGGKPEDASKKQEDLNNKLEKDLKEQLDKFIGNI